MHLAHKSDALLTCPERRSILNNMASIADQYVHGTLGQDSAITTSVNPVRMCRLGAFMLRGQGVDSGLDEEWSTFWEKTALAMKELDAAEAEAFEQQTLADECLGLMETLDSNADDRKLSYAEWLEVFDQGNCRFPEELYGQLDLLSPGEAGQKYRRVRRLREARNAPQVGPAKTRPVSDPA